MKRFARPACAALPIPPRMSPGSMTPTTGAPAASIRRAANGAVCHTSGLGPACQEQSMLNRLLFLLALGLCVATSLMSAAESSVIPVELRCEYRHNPLGIDEARPRLS